MQPKNLRYFESTYVCIFLCFPDQIFRNGQSCVKARVLNSWIRSGGDISEYPRKLRSSSTALRSLGQGGSLGALRNIYARYVAVFLSYCRRPSVPNHVAHVWWKFLLRCAHAYRRAHTRIMFRCWILYLPLCLLWQPHYTIRTFDLSLYWAWFVSFFVVERARLLQPLQELLFSGLFTDYRWHQLSADAWWSADVWFNPGIAWPLHFLQWMDISLLLPLLNNQN